eukprot:Awhi_evm1s5168
MAEKLRKMIFSLIVLSLTFLAGFGQEVPFTATNLEACQEVISFRINNGILAAN